MNDLVNLLGGGVSGVSWEVAMLMLLTAFILGKLVAFTYERTYEGMSYSRAFVQSLVLAAVVSTTLMMAIGDNLARGLGILGTMALVRFRTNVRDSRDMVFVFAALGAGVAAGVQSLPAAYLGTGMFCAVAVLLQWSPFGRRQRFDGMLRFWLPRDGADGETVRGVLGQHCRQFVLVALRDLSQGEALEYAYQIKLRTPDGQDVLVRSLEKLPGIRGLSLLIEDAHTEL